MFQNIHIVGGGIIGAFEAYYAFKEAQKNNDNISITIYEKNISLNPGEAPTNTAFHIVPSLSIDEILSVVPRGSELIDKLNIPFDKPRGIRVNDVHGVNDSKCAINFKNAATLYGLDTNHNDRTSSLLMLGKKSMELWQELYGNDEFKELLIESYFDPCKETNYKVLHKGYRIDLIYGMSEAKKYALKMRENYVTLGYKYSQILTPEDVLQIDPFLADFCKEHAANNSTWKNDSSALWRPGGCIDTTLFLPKIYDYLKKNMKNDFKIKYGAEVIGVELDKQQIIGLKFKDGSNEKLIGNFIFCPGEAVGTLHKFGFEEPTYAAFAGPALFLTIPLTNEQKEKYHNFAHCMEVHTEGIVLAWQARFKQDSIFIGVAGTKAFYGDKDPSINDAFVKNRNLVQLNMINEVLPEFISLAYGYSTKGKNLTSEELELIIEKGVANRWVGKRAVAYDGFPTLGSLYFNNHKIKNARCTTHLGSGGVAFGPGVVYISRASETDDPFIQKILKYSDSRRKAN